MKDELLIEIDTGWHVFNDMALELMSNYGRSTFLSGKVRQQTNLPSTIHEMKDE